MRRRVPSTAQVAVAAVCIFLYAAPVTGSGGVPARGVSNRVFHVITYDKYSRPLQRGQGMIVGPRGIAITSVSVLEGATSALAFLMDGTTVAIRKVLAEDPVSGLATVRLARSASAVSGKPVKSGRPTAGAKILYSTLTRHSGQACVAAVITLVKEVPDLKDLYYVESSQALPRPGGSVFDPDGTIVGIVVLRSRDLSKGILASGGRLSLPGRRSVAEGDFNRWAGRRSAKWEESVYARYLAGQINLWQGRPRETLECVEGLVRPLRKFSPSVAVLLGEAYLALDYQPEAIQAFKAAISFGSPPVRAYRRLAWAYMETRQYAKAERACLKAIQEDPERSSGYTLMAHLHNLEGNYRQAVYEARRALLREPDCACSHFERGRGYLGLGRYRSAIDSFEAATALDPTFSEAWHSLGYARLRKGVIPGAVDALEKTVRLQPETADAWSDLGEAYSRSKRPEKAVHALRLAVCLDPSRESRYCRLASELISQGQYLDAVDILRDGLDRCEGCQWLEYFLGKAFLYQGRGDLAEVQAERLYRENRKLGEQLARLIDQASQG